MKKIYLSIIALSLLLVSPLFADYTLTEQDSKIYEKYSQKIDTVIKTKGEKYRDLFKYVFVEAQDKYSGNIRLQAILTKLIDHLDQIPWGDEFQNLSIDVESVKDAWLSWINDERNTLGLTPYKYNSQLERTSLLWSTLAKEKGTIDHKVSPGDSYYDYNKKAAWMKQNGVVCKNVYRITFSESIGWGEVSCGSGDCTKSLINSIKSSFDFYMSEKGKSYKPHYEAIASKQFTMLGLGIALEKESGSRYKYYLTNHYCTQVQ